VIRELKKRGLEQPFLFIPAGRHAPHLKDPKRPIASLPEEEFIGELLKDYGDHISGILQNGELREVFIPQIRADFALSETYRYRDGPPLDCPIVAFAGVDEDDLGTDQLNAWSVHTDSRFHASRFPGDHFFVRGSEKLVIDAIRKEIDRTLAEFYRRYS
jgi:medium-chain acyl-[acyl-carrier-protein] hydrolase